MLDELERLLKDATPGPWRVEQWDLGQWVVVPPTKIPRTKYVCSTSQIDGELMSAAVNALPALLRVARAAEAWRNAYESNDPSDDTFEAMNAALAALNEVTP